MNDNKIYPCKKCGVTLGSVREEESSGSGRWLIEYYCGNKKCSMVTLPSNGYPLESELCNLYNQTQQGDF